MKETVPFEQRIDCTNLGYSDLALERSYRHEKQSKLLPHSIEGCRHHFGLAASIVTRPARSDAGLNSGGGETLRLCDELQFRRHRVGDRHGHEHRGGHDRRGEFPTFGSCHPKRTTRLCDESVVQQRLSNRYGHERSDGHGPGGVGTAGGSDHPRRETCLRGEWWCCG